MKFLKTNTNQSLGLILAHSFNLNKVRIKKGTVLEKSHISMLANIGVEKIFTVKLEKNDIFENEAAKIIGKVFINQEFIRIGKPLAGRINIYSKNKGVFLTDEKIINASNSIDYSITVSTLTNYTVVNPGQIIATIKIIPYAVEKTILKKFLNSLRKDSIRVFPVKLKKISLIITKKTDQLKINYQSIVDSINSRLFNLGLSLKQVLYCEHEISSLSKILKKNTNDLILIFFANATTDINDVGPTALTFINGKIIRFGMPVDPGNLLFLGITKDHKMIVGLPGCIRSKSLNGADWIIERLICGIPVDDKMITNMGVGGLLKEISLRPRPRIIESLRGSKKIDILLLAAGQSSRMKGKDKLLLEKNGKSLLELSTNECLKVGANKVHVILGDNYKSRMKVLKNLDVNFCIFKGYKEGMGSSIAYGMQLIKPDVDAVIVALADMPKIKKNFFVQLIEGFDINKKNEICRFFSMSNKAGHPTLFGKRFFEDLRALKGETGAKYLIENRKDYLHKIICKDESPIYDIDTPEDFLDWFNN